MSGKKSKEKWWVYFFVCSLFYLDFYFDHFYAKIVRRMLHANQKLHLNIFISSAYFLEHLVLEAAVRFLSIIEEVSTRLRRRVRAALGSGGEFALRYGRRTSKVLAGRAAQLT